jgi:hypothetical protein
MNPYRLIELLLMLAGGVMVGAFSFWWLALMMLIPAAGYALIDIRPDGSRDSR